jgi:hypothetical protein
MSDFNPPIGVRPESMFHPGRTDILNGQAPIGVLEHLEMRTDLYAVSMRLQQDRRDGMTEHRAKGQENDRQSKNSARYRHLIYYSERRRSDDKRTFAVFHIVFLKFMGNHGHWMN